MSRTFGVDYWNRESQQYWKAHPRLRFMARLLARLPQRRVLDIGCSGAALRTLLPPGFDYFGCDITADAALLLPEGRFLQRDFNQTQDLSYFRDKGIDAIHVGGVLEYLNDPGALLRAARDVVPPGAPLVLSIINFESAYYARDSHHHPGWVHKPALDGLLAMLREANWSVERAWPFAHCKGVKAAWFRLWSRVWGWDHAWTRRHARQFILLARAV